MFLETAVRSHYVFLLLVIANVYAVTQPHIVRWNNTLESCGPDSSPTTFTFDVNETQETYINIPTNSQNTTTTRCNWRIVVTPTATNINKTYYQKFEILTPGYGVHGTLGMNDAYLSIQCHDNLVIGSYMNHWTVVGNCIVQTDPSVSECLDSVVFPCYDVDIVFAVGIGRKNVTTKMRREGNSIGNVNTPSMTFQEASGANSTAYLVSHDYPRSICHKDSVCDYYIITPPGYSITYLALTSVDNQMARQRRISTPAPFIEQPDGSVGYPLCFTYANGACTYVGTSGCLPRSPPHSQNSLEILLPAVEKSSWLYPNNGAYLLIQAVKTPPEGTFNCTCGSYANPAQNYRGAEKTNDLTDNGTISIALVPCHSMCCTYQFASRHSDEMIELQLSDYTRNLQSNEYTISRLDGKSFTGSFQGPSHVTLNCTSIDCGSPENNFTWRSASSRMSLVYSTGPWSHKYRKDSDPWRIEVYTVNSSSLPLQCQQAVVELENSGNQTVYGGGFNTYRNCSQIVTTKAENKRTTQQLCVRTVTYSPTVHFDGICFENVTATITENDEVLFEYNDTSCALNHTITATGDTLRILWSRQDADITEEAHFVSSVQTRIAEGSTVCLVVSVLTVALFMLILVITLFNVYYKVMFYKRRMRLLKAKQRIREYKERSLRYYLRDLKVVYGEVVEG